MTNQTSSQSEFSTAKRQLLLQRLRERAQGAPALTPVPVNGPVPLSFSQQRLWFMEQLAPGMPNYHIPVCYRLQGNLDTAIVGSALALLMQRQAVLRTVFLNMATGPAQQVLSSLPIPLVIDDVSHLPENDRERRAMAMLTERAQQCFSMSEEPLWRCHLVRVGDGESFLCLTMHHLIADGWSIGVFWQDFSAAYRALQTSQTPQWAPLSIAATDVAAWEQRCLTTDERDRLKAYWQTRLAGLEYLTLPVDHPRAVVSHHRGAKVLFEISAETGARLKQCCQALDCTPFMFLLSALAILLQRYSRQSDVCIGTAVANRPHPQIEPLIGFFVNTLALRLDLDGNPSFPGLLQQVRQVTLEAGDHQSLPFQEVVDSLGRDRDPARHPVTPVMFTLQSAKDEGPQLTGISASPEILDLGVSAFDLAFSLEERAEGVLGVIQFDTDLFDKARVECMAGHYGELIGQLCRDPHRPIGDYSLLTAAEQHAWQQQHVSHRATSANMCLHQLVEIQAAQAPHRIAIRAGQQTLSYGELNTKANRLAHHLNTLGVGAETLVAICAERGPELAIGLLAILKAGAAYLPLDPSYPASRLDYILRDAAVPLLLTHQSLLSRLPESSTRVLCLDPEQPFWQTAPEHNPCYPSRPEHLAYCIYTSGSTGNPKGTLLEHRQVVRLFTETQHWFAFSQDDVWSVFHSIAFDFSVWEFWGALTTGGRAVFIPYEVSRSPEDFLTMLASEQVSMLSQTPSAFRSLLSVWQGRGVNLPHLRHVVFGGEALDYASLAPWFTHYGTSGPQLTNMYGITETTVHVTYRPVKAEDVTRAASPIGIPIPDLSVYVVDPAGHPAPIGVPGEIWVSGAGVARGYLNRPDLTAARFTPDPFAPETQSRLYRSGDLGCWRSDGELDYLGRIDHQVKLRGFRIELGEIEAALLRQPGIREAVALVQDLGPGDQRLVAYVTEAPGHLFHEKAVLEVLQHTLPSFMVPAVIVALPTLPLTGNGKLDRKALPDPYAGSADAADASRALPRTPLELDLAKVWTELLKPKQAIGIHDNFFALGGHSLLAVQAASLTGHGKLPLRTFFAHPTIAEQAKILLTTETRLDSELPIAPPDQSHFSAFAQRSLWFIDAYQRSSQYHIPLTWALHGALNRQALEQAWDELLARHEALRSCFEDGEEAPRLRTLPAWPGVLETIDVSLQANPAEQALQLLTQHADAPFDLAVGPLLRVVLIKLAEDHHYLQLTVHHIIADGGSLGILIRELGQSYTNHCRDEGTPLPKLARRYCDYTAWQQGRYQTGAFEPALTYWRNYLEGVPLALELPTTKTRPTQLGTDGALIRFEFGESAAHALRSLAERNGATPFMVGMAVFATVLARYSGQCDVCIGYPVANRPTEACMQMVGLFTNTLVLRVQLQPHTSADMLLQNIKHAVLEAQTHQELPFDQLVEALRPKRSADRTPLFQVMCSFASGEESALRLPTLSCVPHPLPSTTAKFELGLDIVDVGGALSASLEFNTALFDEAYAWRLAGHIQQLLLMMAEKPDQSVLQLNMLTAEEREQLQRWGTPALAKPVTTTIPALFDHMVTQYAAHPAVVGEAGQLSYRELQARADSLAAELQEYGVSPDTLVALYVDRSLEMVIGMLAILKAGGAYVPLDPSYPEDRVQFVLQDAGATLLLTRASMAQALPSCQSRVVLIDADRPERPAPDVALSPAHLAYCIYTSGSTGKPKGVLIEHQHLSAQIDALQRAYKITHQDRMLQFAPMAFDMSVEEIFGALLTGATLVLRGDSWLESTSQFIMYLQTYGVTVANLPTAFWRILAEEHNHALPHTLRKVMVGGEAIRVSSLQAWFARPGPCPELYNAYGPTEATVNATVQRYDCPEDISDYSIGHPLLPVALHVLDEYGLPVPIGVPGELYIGGACVARGYHGRPELTAERFVVDPRNIRRDRMYRTGDRARFLPDGRVEYLGRVDHQVKIRGFRIEPGEVEHALLRCPGVAEAAVIPCGPNGGQYLAAFLVMRAEAVYDNTEILNGLKSSLPEYMTPSVFQTLDSLPLTPNRKVDRLALAKRAPSRQASQAHVAPRNTLELQIARIWEEVLGIRPISVTDGFFDLGGHSLLAIRLLSRIRQELGMVIPLNALFEAGTIEAMAARCHEQAQDQGWNPLIKVQPAGQRRPFFMIHSASGQVFPYGALAAQLGVEQPFYGILARGLEGQPVFESVEVMAAHYVEVIRAAQAEGPYLLGSWSVGGIFAYEVARQLRAQGQTVGLLALLDTIPVCTGIYDGADAAGAIEGMFPDVGLDQTHLRTLGEACFPYALDVLKQAKRVPPDFQLEELVARVTVWTNHAKIAHAYQPGSFDGALVYIRPMEGAEDETSDIVRRWQQHAQAVELRRVQGDHESMVLPPHVTSLASELAHCIWEATWTDRLPPLPESMAERIAEGS